MNYMVIIGAASTVFAWSTRLFVHSAYFRIGVVVATITGFPLMGVGLAVTSSVIGYAVKGVVWGVKRVVKWIK